MEFLTALLRGLVLWPLAVLGALILVTFVGGGLYVAFLLLKILLTAITATTY